MEKNGLAKDLMKKVIYYISGDFVRHLEFEGKIINGKRGENLKDKKVLI